MAYPHRAYQPDVATHGGEGITRTSEPGARLFWVEVRAAQSAPLYSYVRAMSAQQAIEFSRNRHPNAVMIRLMEGE